MIGAAKAGPDRAGTYAADEDGHAPSHPGPHLLMLLAASTHGYWNLQTLWFFLIVVLWIGYFVLEGFDFGVGMLLPFVGRDERRARDAHPHDRPGLGRQRGVAARRRRRDVRGLPRLVRDALLRLLPRALPRARRPDRARHRDRVPQQAAGRAVARAAGTRSSPSRAPCRRCSGASRSRTSCTACPSTRSGDFTGNLLDLLDPYALFGGVTTLAALRLPRRALPRAAHDRRAASARARRRHAARAAGGRSSSSASSSGRTRTPRARTTRASFPASSRSPRSACRSRPAPSCARAGRAARSRRPPCRSRCSRSRSSSTSTRA